MPSKISDKLLQIDPDGYSPVTDACHIIKGYIKISTIHGWRKLLDLTTNISIATTIIAFLATLTKKELLLLFSTQETNRRFNNSPSRCLGSGSDCSGNSLTKES